MHRVAFVGDDGVGERAAFHVHAELMVLGGVAGHDFGERIFCPGFPFAIHEHFAFGQVVGEHVHDNDLVINVCKAKQLTNVRASGTDDKARIIPKTVMSLEECLEYIKEDELVEVTPQSMRMRKIILDHDQRKKAGIRVK